jgi:hypothetical protein
MVHTRETRASASEIKFLIDPGLAPRIRDWARTHLQPDPHGTGQFGDDYDTSSLYFDTRHFDVFHRRRSFARAKYRVRRYGDSDVVFLERKLRKPDLLIKRRTVSSLDSLTRLHRPEDDRTWEGAWFQRRLQMRKLRPVCQVSYHRTARVIMCPEGLARLTLDGRLRAVHTTESAFTRDHDVTFLDDRMILELKYRVRVPAIFRRLVEAFALETASASKYRLAMAALGHMPASDEPEVIAGYHATYA